MLTKKDNEVIIIGGSYAGLSAAMALGRSLRNVLVIDSGAPCNTQTPYSHNFLTQDGEKPAEIAEQAREQVLKYPTVKFYRGLATDGKKTGTGFEITTRSGKTFTGKKLIFATGLRDIMPGIKGFAECWGISVLHCPYCHGYEVREEKTGILADGDAAYHYAQLVRNLTKDLTVFTNGRSAFSPEQLHKMSEHNIPVIEKEIDRLVHENGYVRQVVFKDGSKVPLTAIYSRPEYEQHCKIPENLGCELNDSGLLKVDELGQTSVEGVYACGDNSIFRAIAMAVSTGMKAGAGVNYALTSESF